jgi:cytochrome c oxidase cbb3-type subunit 4
MTYETVSMAAQQGGSIYLFLLFLAGAVYALWPRKRDEFDRAARAPLDEDQ